MNILVLRPGLRTLPYTVFADGRRAVRTGRLSDYRGEGGDPEAMAMALHTIRVACGQVSAMPGVIAIRTTFGGPDFSGPTIVTDDVLARLEAQVPNSPLLLPAVLMLARAAADVFPDVPVVLVFETGLFANLPAREYTYGLNAELAHDLGLRRYGYHGIYHRAACAEAARHRPHTGPAAPTSPAARVISICLEPRPEVAALVGCRPVMVTSGTTPLEGLPGETTCGELDPSIILILAEKMKWGPEQINAVLTRSSGIAGMVGEAATLEEVLHGARPNLRQTRRVLRYRILLACGAAVAAMGGVDAIVFSGRYASAGATLGPTLASRLARRSSDRKMPPVAWHIVRSTLDRLIADEALPAALGVGAEARRIEVAKANA
jgi:acetate kinase